MTQIPDLVFGLNDGKQVWQVRYNSVKGSVAAKRLSEVPPTAVTWRTFMTRLHTIHGYPFAWGPRWIWTLFVDLMAALMVFWGMSGLLLWWQIKSTRKMGFGIVTMSICIAVFLASSLYYWLAVSI